MRETDKLALDALLGKLVGDLGTAFSTSLIVLGDPDVGPDHPAAA